MELVAQPSLSLSLLPRVPTRPSIPCLRSDDDDDVLNPMFGDFGAVFPAARPPGDLRPRLEGAAPVPTCPPCRRTAGHSWPRVCGRHGAHLAGQMWGSTKGSPVGCFHLPVPAQLAGHPQGTHGSPAPSRCGAGGGSSARGAREAPRPAGMMWPGTRRAVFGLAVLSCRGGRAIWASLCRPNKPGMRVRCCKSRSAQRQQGCRAQPAGRA